VPAGREFSLREAIGEITQALDGAGGLLQTVKGEIELTAVGNTGESEAQRGGFVALGEEVAEGEEIAEGLGHFLAFDEKMLGVEPVADKVFASGGFALRDFVFVMGKGEIDAASVDVNCFTEIFQRAKSRALSFS
jgi:hypothetical protein